MRRTLTAVAAWVATAAVAFAIAWQGVGVATREVTSSRPAPLSVDGLTGEPDGAGGTAPAGTPGGSGDPDAVAGTTTTSTASGPAGGTAATAPRSGGGSPPGTAPAGIPTPASTTTVPTTTTTAPVTPSTTPTTEPAGEVRTYQLVGGSAALRFTPEGVTVEWATPAAGFSVEIEPEHGNGVKVEFRSDSHRSRVDGWWEGGPRDRIREEPLDDDDD